MSKKTPTQQEYITVREATRVAQVSQKTIYNYVRQEKVKHKKDKGLMLVCIADLQTLTNPSYKPLSKLNKRAKTENDKDDLQTPLQTLTNPSYKPPETNTVPMKVYDDLVALLRRKDDTIQQLIESKNRADVLLQDALKQKHLQTPLQTSTVKDAESVSDTDFTPYKPPYKPLSKERWLIVFAVILLFALVVVGTVLLYRI